MTRKYGPIGTTIWTSKRFLKLKNDTNRLAFIYLVACPHGNSLGVFKLPVVYFAADRGLTVGEAEAVLDDMQSVGLIERGDEEQIRIPNWFYQDTGAGNPSTVSAFCKVFKDNRLVRPGPLRTAAIAEMVLASLEIAEGWNPTTAPFGKMSNDLTSFLIAEGRRDIDALKIAFSKHHPPEPQSIAATILDTVGYTLSDTLYHIRKQKRETETDTDTDTGDGDGHGDGDGAQHKNQAEPPSAAPPSLPPDGGQSGQLGKGKRSVPTDVQETIKSLNRA